MQPGGADDLTVFPGDIHALQVLVDGQQRAGQHQSFFRIVLDERVHVFDIARDGMVDLHLDPSRSVVIVYL
ncbi:hypothetical protein A0O32_1774 [Anoxybacillus flavithermus]|nr:hypothetical protein A0O32_1774 [Anoxybacillus flavithermus]